MARTKKPKAPKSTPGVIPPSSDTWWSQQVEAPRSDLPDPDKQSRRAKRLRYVVWATVIFAPISAFTNFAYFANADSGTAEVVAVDEYAETRPYAIVTVRQWLAQDPSPLPGGVLIGWDRAESEEFTPDSNSDDVPYAVETHYLTVAAANGVTFTTTVPIAVDATSGPVAMSTPSLIPVAPSADWEALPYPNSTPTSLTDEATNAIGKWASDYTNPDPEYLRAAIADPDTDHYYVPLAGASLTVESVTGAWVSPRATNTDEQGALPDYVFAEVEASIKWLGTGSDGSAPTVTYTLLISDANTGAARVVAWGGPGTGLGLEPFGNAVSREIADANSTVISDGEETVISDDVTVIDEKDAEGVTVDGDSINLDDSLFNEDAFEDESGGKNGKKDNQ